MASTLASTSNLNAPSALADDGGGPRVHVVLDDGHVVLVLQGMMMIMVVERNH